ncbi:MAG TPA: penicillin acylase family protein [Pyrinomonadaceae bacterium]|nr:penicillin acylase family protein [Pyrinomonadaceae bacterium]
MRKSRFLACLILSLCLFVSLSFVPNAARPVEARSQQSAMRFAGLREQVTVRRDERGIPYIEAANLVDLCFAQGYVTASDRLWQMELLRRSMRGEAAEVLGSAVLEQDKMFRTYGFAQVAEAEVAAASKEAREQLEAYARGVNAYMESLDAKTLPPEFQILQFRPRPWTPADSLLIVKLFFEFLSDTWQTDLMRAALMTLPADKREALLVETSPLDVVVVGSDKPKTKAGASKGSDVRVDVETLRALNEARAKVKLVAERLGVFDLNREASNNWVVSGRRTVTGKPLLANDPHLLPSAPSIWYMVHLSAPGLRVAGVTSPGLPGVVIGHNDRIAWGFTNVGPDVSDLYLEKFDPQNPKRYQTPAGWRDATVRREEIRVRKGFTSTETETQVLDVTVTRHGPVVFERAGKRYALQWTALDPKLGAAEGFFALNTARNWTEFQAALAKYTAPMQNMVYADVDGHIGYTAAGRVPLRKSGDGSLPYDGSSDAGEWTGYIPFEKLPRLFDPPSGIIVTANQRVVGTDYPYFLTHEWAAPYRARRILELLEAKPKLTIEDFRAIQGDTFSIPGDIFYRQTVKTLKDVNFPLDSRDAEGDRLLKLALASFQNWDGRANPDSGVAPLVAEMRVAFRNRVLNAAIGEELAKEYGWGNSGTLIDRLITEQPRSWLPKEFTMYADLLLACYKDAREALTKRLGEDETKWTWGRYAQVSFSHPLARVPLIGQQFLIPPFPQSGAGPNITTVNVGRSVSMRFIADTSDWDRTQHGITLGQSGLPTSPHWKDQLEDWRNVTPRAFPFTRGAVERATRETIVLLPAG